MSVVIFKPTESGFVQEMCEPDVLHVMLTDGGWYLSPDDFPSCEDAPLLEDMENHEIRALAKEAGIENHDDARIATLIKKLRAIDDNEG